MASLFGFADRSVLGELIEKALEKENDWSTILEICDLIIENKSRPKIFLRQIRPHIKSENQKRAINSIQILDSASKNCGWPLHKEISSDEFMKFIAEQIQQDNQPQVTAEIVKLLNFWRIHLKDTDGYSAIEKVVKVATDRGYQMTDLDTSHAMIKADVLPQWKDSNTCSVCDTSFTFINRKHHCRSCGAIVCAKCSPNTSVLTKYKITTPVRVCNSCNTSINGKEMAEKKRDPDMDFDDQLAKALEESLEMEKNRLKESDILERYKNFGGNEKSADAPEPYESIPATNLNLIENSTEPPQEQSSAPPISELQQFSYPETAYESQQISESDYIPGPITTERFAPKEFVDSFKSSLKSFNLRLQTCIQRNRPIHTDTGLHNSFTSLCGRYTQLREIIEHIYNRRGYFEGLQDKVTEINEAMEALVVMREEHAQREREKEEEAEMKRQMMMNSKVDWLRKCKKEYYDYQRFVQMQNLREGHAPPYPGDIPLVNANQPIDNEGRMVPQLNDGEGLNSNIFPPKMAQFNPNHQLDQSNNTFRPGMPPNPPQPHPPQPHPHGSDSYYHPMFPSLNPYLNFPPQHQPHRHDRPPMPSNDEVNKGISEIPGHMRYALTMGKPPHSYNEMNPPTQYSGMNMRDYPPQVPPISESPANIPYERIMTESRRLYNEMNPPTQYSRMNMRDYQPQDLIPPQVPPIPVSPAHMLYSRQNESPFSLYPEMNPLTQYNLPKLNENPPGNYNIQNLPTPYDNTLQHPYNVYDAYGAHFPSYQSFPFYPPPHTNLNNNQNVPTLPAEPKRSGDEGTKPSGGEGTTEAEEVDRMLISFD